MSGGVNGKPKRGRTPRNANTHAGAAVLKAHMIEHELTGEQIAGSLWVQCRIRRAASTVRRWADGENPPSEEDAALLDECLGLAGSLLHAYYPSAGTVTSVKASTDGTVATHDPERPTMEAASTSLGEPTPPLG